MAKHSALLIAFVALLCLPAQANQVLRCRFKQNGNILNTFSCEISKSKDGIRSVSAHEAVISYAIADVNLQEDASGKKSTWKLSLTIIYFDEGGIKSYEAKIDSPKPLENDAAYTILAGFAEEYSLGCKVFAR